MKTFTGFFILFIFMMWCFGSTPVEARRIYLTVEQNSQLGKAQTVLLEVLTLSEKVTYDTSPLAATVKKRLEEGIR